MVAGFASTWTSLPNILRVPASRALFFIILMAASFGTLKTPLFLTSRVTIAMIVEYLLDVVFVHSRFGGDGGEKIAGFRHRSNRKRLYNERGVRSGHRRTTAAVFDY